MGSENDDWDFKLDEKFVKEKEKSHSPREQLARELKSAKGLPSEAIKNRPPKMELDFEGVPHKTSRSRLADRINSEQNDAPFPPPPLHLRLWAGLIDLGLAGICLGASYGICLYLQGPITDYANELALEHTGSSFSSRHIEDYFHPLLKLVVFVLFYAWPCLIFANSLGKRLVGIEILHQDLENLPGRGQILARELLLKPLSVALLVGVLPIFLRSDKRGVHDLICKTFLYR